MNDLIIKDTITDLSENKRNFILESFSPVVQSLNDFGKQFLEIQAMETDKEKCKKAKRFRIDFGKQITRADAIRKELKEESLKEGKAVQTVFNYIKKATEETKQAALDIELHFEKLETEKRKLKQAERENELLKYESDCSNMDLGGMDETIWGNFLAGTKSNYEAKKESERQAEEDRVEAEQIETLHADRKNSVLDLWQFMPEENRNISFGEWADDMWDELVNYLYLAKADYDKKQAKIKFDNERLQREAEATRLENQRIEKLWRSRLSELLNCSWNGQEAVDPEKETVIISYNDIITIDDKAFNKIKNAWNKIVTSRKITLQKEKEDADKAEETRIADEEKAEKLKKDRIKKYSKKLLEAGYQSDRPGVYVLGMYRVVDSQLETLSDKEFQDRLAECKKGHKRDLQLKKEQEDKDRLKKEASDKAAADKKEADRKAAAPDKEKMSVLIDVLVETRSLIKKVDIRNYLYVIIEDMKSYIDKL